MHLIKPVDAALTVKGINPPPIIHYRWAVPSQLTTQLPSLRGYNAKCHIYQDNWRRYGLSRGGEGRKKWPWPTTAGHASAPFHPASFRFFLYTSSLSQLFFSPSFHQFSSPPTESFTILSGKRLFASCLSDNHTLFRAATHTILLI